MKTTFKFKFIMLLAVLAVAFIPTIDARVIQPVAHYLSSFTPQHIIGTSLSFAAVPLLATYVKENCTILTAELAQLTEKYGKIQILTVVIEPPTYDEDGNLTNPGEFYDFAVRRPDISLIKMLRSYAGEGNDQKYLDACVSNLIVGGAMDKLNPETGDGVVYLGVLEQMRDVLKPFDSFLSKA